MGRLTGHFDPLIGAPREFVEKRGQRPSRSWVSPSERLYDHYERHHLTDT